jgi:hypothetical protein
VLILKAAVDDPMNCRRRIDWTAIIPHPLVLRLAEQIVGFPNQRLALGAAFSCERTARLGTICSRGWR